MVGGWVDPIGKSPTKVFASLVAQWIDLRSPARHKTIYGHRDYREYGRTSIEPIERLKISEICVLPLPRATIYPHIFNSIWQNLCNNFCVGFQRLEDIGNAQIILQCNSKSRPVQGDREATGDCMLFSVNWWPWLEQLREEAHSGRDWLADEYWIATCLRKYWIATAPRLRKGPAEQGRKFKTWGKVCWLWAITRRKIQIYGNWPWLVRKHQHYHLQAVVCHIERDFYLHCSMDGYLCGAICGNNWEELTTLCQYCWSQMWQE